MSLQLAEATRIVREATRDHSYRATPVGQEVGRFMRALRWSGHSPNTISNYETTLSKLSEMYADFDSLERFAAPDGTELVRDFLDKYWADSSIATRANRLAAVKSFFNWGVGEGRLGFNPATSIKSPRVRNRERRSYPLALLRELVRAQPSLQDQVALQLLVRLGLRKNELRLLQIQDFDLGRSEVRIQRKGGKITILPFSAITQLKEDLYLHITAGRRQPEEFLLHPRSHPERPMTSSTIHRWFKRCADRAGIPAAQLHELRHSAADMLWRETGDIMKATELLGHESPETTRRYLHPTREDLTAGLRVVDALWEDE